MDMFEFFQMTDRLYKVRTRIQEFLHPEDKQAQANEGLASEQYDFYGLVVFLQRVGFDMQQISNKPGGLASDPATSTPSQQDRGGQPIEVQYKDLCDLYNAVRDNRPMLSRADVCEVF